MACIGACLADLYWPFWFLGLLNNVGYVVVLSSSKSLADSFNAGDQIGAINWVLVGLGVVVRLLNTLRLEGRVSFRTRIWWCGLGFGVGTAGLAGTVMAAPHAPFALALFFILILGGSCSLGESVILGYLEAFPPTGVSGWSSGTGMAGLGGSGFYLALAFAGASNFVVYITLLPCAAAYVFIFRRLSTTRAATGPQRSLAAYQITAEAHEKSGQEHADQDAGRAAAEDGGDRAALLAIKSMPDRHGAMRQEEEAVVAQQPREHWWSRTRRCFPYVRRYAANLGFVYFFEYVIQVAGASLANDTDSGASRTTTATPHTDTVKAHAFALLSLTYQVGVFIARSSLSFVKVKRIEILTVLQALNFAWWSVQARWQPWSIGAQLACMAWVGLMGGAMYVNVFALMVNDHRIPAADREFSINIVAIAINIGIVSASIFDLAAVPLVRSARGDT